MAQMNQDNMVKTLTGRNVAAQDRIAASGRLTGLCGKPPAVLSHAWRPMSPGSLFEADPTPRSVMSHGLMAPVKRAGRPAASRSGLTAVTGGASAAPFEALHQTDSHDCLSHDCRGVRTNGLAGYRPGRCGMAPAYSRGRG